MRKTVRNAKDVKTHKLPKEVQGQSPQWLVRENDYHCDKHVREVASRSEPDEQVQRFARFGRNYEPGRERA